MNYLWNYKNASTISSLSELLDVLLKNRELTSLDLIPSHPSDLISEIISQKDLENFCKMILENSNNQILIYADYDVDGVASAAILHSSLHALGIDPIVYIPNRRTDGYGLNRSRLQSLLTDHPQIKLLITVDNGISANQAIEDAKNVGIKVGIIDHHHQPEKLPPYDALIYSNLTSASVLSWILSQHLANFPDSLSLATLGMIADVIPLTGFNRSIAYHGLKQLNQTKHPGIKSLIQASGLLNQIDSGQVAFQLAPRLNASGRIDDASKSFQLLISKDLNTALLLANELNNLNSQRQILTIKALEFVDTQIDGLPLIIANHSSFDEGIIGLVAARLLEKYYRPAVVLSVGDDISKASVRSHSHINIIEFLTSASKHFLTLGGHPQAAGFTVKTSLLSDLISDLNEASREWPVHQPTLSIDSSVEFDLIKPSLVSQLDQFAPFGMGNSKPIFSIRGICQKINWVGSTKQHLSGTISQNRQFIKFIAFNYHGEPPKVGQMIEIAGSFTLNEWQGNVSVDLQLKDWRAI